MHGEIPKGMCILHYCDNPVCVNPSHLFLGSLRDNNLDMRAKGRATLPLRGEDNHWAKLTDSQVLQIRNAIGSQRAIGKQFGIDQSWVSRIKNAESWKHV